MSLSENEQFPLNGLGNRMQDGFVAVEKMFFTGPTGLIATMFGIPGVTATRVSTGLYQFAMPPMQAVEILPGVEGPTGTAYQVNIPRATKGSASGAFQVQFYERQVALGTGASGYLQPTNPATGTALNLVMIGSPIRSF